MKKKNKKKPVERINFILWKMIKIEKLNGIATSGTVLKDLMLFFLLQWRWS